MLMRENLMHAAGGCWVVQINNPSMLGVTTTFIEIASKKVAVANHR